MTLVPTDIWCEHHQKYGCNVKTNFCSYNVDVSRLRATLQELAYALCSHGKNYCKNVRRCSCWSCQEITDHFGVLLAEKKEEGK